jgi:hypothetical protein
MIASDSNLRVDAPRGGTRQPPECPRLMAVPVVAPAVVNASFVLLMAGRWARMTDGMLELATGLRDHLTEIINRAGQNPSSSTPSCRAPRKDLATLCTGMAGNRTQECRA